MVKQLNHYLGDQTHEDIEDLKEELDLTWSNIYVGIAESEEIRDAFRNHFEGENNE